MEISEVKEVCSVVKKSACQYLPSRFLKLSKYTGKIMTILIKLPAVSNIDKRTIIRDVALAYEKKITPGHILIQGEMYDSVYLLKELYHFLHKKPSR